MSFTPYLLFSAILTMASERFSPGAPAFSTPPPHLKGWIKSVLRVGQVYPNGLWPGLINIHKGGGDLQLTLYMCPLMEITQVFQGKQLV